MRMVTDMRLDRDGTGSHRFPVMRGFEVVDSIMAIRQLQGIKARAETFGFRASDPHTPEHPRSGSVPALRDDRGDWRACRSARTRIGGTVAPGRRGRSA